MRCIALLALILLPVWCAMADETRGLTPEAVLGGSLAGQAVLTTAEIELWDLALSGCGCRPAGANERMFGTELPLAAAACTGLPAPRSEVDLELSRGLAEREELAAALSGRLWRRVLVRLQLLRAAPASRNLDQFELDDALLAADRATAADLACISSLDAANRYRTGHTIRVLGRVRPRLDRPYAARSGPGPNDALAIELRGGETIELHTVAGLYAICAIGGRRAFVDPRLFSEVLVEIDKGADATGK